MLSPQLSKPIIGKEEQSLGLSLGPHRVYTECLEVYTESTQKNSGSIQSLHRVIWGLHRVYTEQFLVYTESTQSDLQSTQSLYRAIQVQNRVYTE